MKINIPTLKTNLPDTGPSAEEIKQMEKALSERPSFSIRVRITLAFMVAFLFSLAIGIASIIYISKMNEKQTFFDDSARFAFTVEQARRHEKNYFLYRTRTDLYDAISNVETASEILDQTSAKMQFLLKHDTFKQLRGHLQTYERLLKQIAYPGDGTSLKPKPYDIEGRLRIHGHRIVTDAMDLIAQERIKVQKAAQTFMLTAGFSLILGLIAMIWAATEMARQILKPLSRAVQYTDRIASGDFSLIIPQRKFRDEFSNLAIAINRMIFEVMEKHEQLVQSRKMAAVGTLTSGIAHELNNPLNNISITTESLMEGLEDYTEEEIMEMLKDIFIQVERCSATVRNLLDFTRVGRTAIQNIDTAKLIRSSLELVKNEQMVKQIETKVLLPSYLPSIKGHFRNLQQVLLNIFLNGIQAMPDGGILTIQAGLEEEGFVRINISDKGYGIPRKNLKKIFDPFFTTKDVGAGTGLGLSVSYGIVQELGGRITVASEEGRGTTFSIFLPVAEADF